MQNHQDVKKEKRDPQEISTPGERASRVIISMISWFKDLLNSFHVRRPEGQVIEHKGKPFPVGIESRFTDILIVEDNLQTAKALRDLIRNYYRYGEITLYLAYHFKVAVSFFSHFSNGERVLIIMDSDLTDPRGDGIALTTKFHQEKPEAVILANSSSKVSNLQMESCGAFETVEKNYAKLHEWLIKNDPAGSGNY